MRIQRQSADKENGMRMFCARWSLALLMGITFTSTANTPIPLGIGGSMVPPMPADTNCTMSVSSPVVDYGLMSRGQLQNLPGENVTPGSRSLTLSVVCPYSRTMKLLVEGESREHGELRYGKRGVTQFRLLDVQLDGHPVELQTLTSAGELTGADSLKTSLLVGQRWIPVILGRFAEGKTLTARLDIQPMIPETEVRVSSPQLSESMLTLRLVN